MLFLRSLLQTLEASQCLELNGNKMNDRKKRLSEFERIPFFAQLDHRRFLDDSGELPFLKVMSRRDRRKLKADSKKIGRQYREILERISRSGVGFPTDQLLRSMAIEYTHRFASSGTEHLPVSFNYFEPFCEGRLLPQSVAPYMALLPELHHLFHASDFFDYLTSSDSSNFQLAALLSLPESQVYHFTANGDILEISFTDARSREYVLSGFSMVRRNNSIHWSLIAGELLSEEEWTLRSCDSTSIDLQNITPSKRAFLSNIIEQQGNTSGPPVRLEGTESAVKTVLAGEIDAHTGRHMGRAVFVESENAYIVFCDDPEVLSPIPESPEKSTIICQAMDRLNEAGALFSIAEGLLQLPSYFESRVTIDKNIAGSTAVPKGMKGKGGKGVSAKFQVVESVAVTKEVEAPMIRRIRLPQYSTETEGHWRRIKFGEKGKDRNGNPVAGKTWVKGSNPWRARSDHENVIYVKDSLAVAKKRVAELYQKAQLKNDDNEVLARSTQGELYVLRCTLMRDEVYKVGWTSGSSSDRAKELSAATGVPISFEVVHSWKHDDARSLEAEVHAMMAPYRLNNQREFFQIEFGSIKRIIEQTIDRLIIVDKKS